jgi:putative transposase
MSSGFERTTQRNYGWAIRGKKVHRERSGNSRPRTRLIAAKRGKQILAPILFEGSTDSIWFNDGFERHLFKELRPKSKIITPPPDNAPFHKKKDICEITSQHELHLLFLPPYSPDFNPIEKDFANIKKIRAFDNQNTTLDDIVKSYGN